MQKIKLPDTQEDITVERARRKENIRGALKLFRVLLDAVKRHTEWVEARHGIGGAQLWVLWELAQAPGMRSVDLARSMAVHRKTAEELLSDLMATGLVRVEDSAQSHVYFLTPDGQSIADATPEYGQGVFKAALERLSDPALDQVIVAMRSITDSLPFREESAALKPMADILRPSAPASESLPAGNRRNDLET